MLSEGFVASIRAQPKTANTAIAKDVGIYVHTLQPNPSVKSTFKKSSTAVNSLAVSSTHIFAAQVDKAVIHVYSRERGNQEALVSFPERIHSLTLAGDGILVLGTAEGRSILWEVCTGRQVMTPAAHLQPVSCVAATLSHIVTASDDSNIHVWSLPRLLSLSSKEVLEPLRSLSNHRAAITSVSIGHSSTSTNIGVSASRDNTIIVWNYHTGDLLRTFLLPSIPLCLVLDPCDRAVFVGFEDGTLQIIEFLQRGSTLNPLYNKSLQNTPKHITLPPWTTPSDFGPTLCLNMSYDGTSVLSGHGTGKIAQWEVGRRVFSSEVVDLNAPVTNLIMLSPFQQERTTKAITIIKPKLGDGNYTFTAKLTGTIGLNPFNQVLNNFGFPSNMLERSISDLCGSPTTSSTEDQKLRQENEDLWNLVHEQRVLQKQTLEKFSSRRSSGV